jgi:hypothetical protein
MRGSIPPLPHTSSWCGCLMKHRGSFCFFMHTNWLKLLYAARYKTLSFRIGHSHLHLFDCMNNIFHMLFNYRFSAYITNLTEILPIIRRSFEKYVDSPYYSELELCGGAVTVSFSKYLPWQAMRFLQRSAHFSKPYCRQLITSKFLTSELPFHGWKSPKIARGEIWTVWRMF